MFNDREIAVRLEWDDPTRNVEHAEPGAPKLGRFGYVLGEERTRDMTLRDAVRVQLAAPDAERPHFLLGSRGAPVTLWHWRAGVDHATTDRAEGPDAPPVEIRGAPVDAHGTWAEGTWRVVLVRQLASETARQVTLARGTLVPFAGQVGMTLIYLSVPPPSAPPAQKARLQAEYPLCYGQQMSCRLSGISGAGWLGILLAAMGVLWIARTFRLSAARSA